MPQNITMRLLASLLTISSIFATQLASAQDEDYQLPERGFCAHRGDWTSTPENTVPSFVAAALAGAQMIEFDIKATSDGKLIIMHDTTVDRTTNGSGEVCKMSFEEIRQLKINSPYPNLQVPTLEEALNALPHNVWLFADFDNNDDLVLPAAEIIKAQNRFNQTLFAVKRKGMEQLRSVYPNAKICCMEREKDPNLFIQHAIDWKCDFLTLNEPYTSEQIAALKKANIKINYFGPYDPEILRQRFEDGIDFPVVNYFTKDRESVKDVPGFKLNVPEKEYVDAFGDLLPQND